MNASEPNLDLNKTTVASNILTVPKTAEPSYFSTGESPVTGASSPTLSGLLQALRRRWFVAGGLALAAALLAVFTVFQLMPAKYVVGMRIRIAAKPANADDVEFAIIKASMESLVKSPTVINAALNDKLPDGREVKELDLIRQRGIGAADWLEKSLKTDYLLGPEVLHVTLSAENAEEAAELLNAVATAFVNVCAEMERAKRQPRLQDLRNAKERQEETLRKLNGIHAKQMEDLKVDDRETAHARLALWQTKQTAAEAHQRNNEDEIIKANNDIITLQAKLKNVDRYKVPEDVLEAAFSKDRVIDEYFKQIAEIDKTIGTYKAKFNEPFASAYIRPLVAEKENTRNLKRKHEQDMLPELERIYRITLREDMKRQLETATEVRLRFLTRRESLLKELQGIEQKVKEASQSNFNVPPQIATTREKIEVAKKGLDQISQKMLEVEMEGSRSRVNVEARPSAPLSKDISRQTKIAGAGSMGIFCMVLLGVAFLEFRSCKISLSGDVSQGLGLHVLGTVPAMPARSRRGSANSAAQEQLWQNQLHESLDAVRTVILHHARQESLRVIMVSSARSGEGKTTLATQLAASLARAWKRTLIVDGDLRHPATHTLFDVAQQPGFAEILRGEVNVADAIRATPFSRLWVLPAGNGDNHAIQALAQDSVQTIFETLKEQYDFIIVDSPPLLPVTDSLLLAQHADGVLFSVLRDVSRAPAVYAAKQKLAPLGVPVLGAVILGTQMEYGDKNYRYEMAAK